MNHVSETGGKQIDYKSVNLQLEMLFKIPSPRVNGRAVNYSRNRGTGEMPCTLP